MDHKVGGGEEACRVPLLHLHGDESKKEHDQQLVADDAGSCDLRTKVCEESKKLWEIVGPAIFTRTATYSLNVIMQAFAGHLGDLELAAVSFACTVLVGFNYGLMLLENWYYRILILLTGNLKNAAVAVDALSICMMINGWEMMIPLAFFAGTGVRVANELGAGNGKGAKFAAIVSSTTSLVIGIFFWVLIMVFHDKIALIFTTSVVVLDAVDKLSILLAFTILLNSIQPVLSATVAYVNIGCYYIIGIPMGILLGWLFNLGVLGIWAGMIGGTAVQTLILTIITVRCNWEKEAMIASTRMEKLSQAR
ncbi:hypothetical protein ACP70R_031411 [Stipagrostis hirtigluma subsp. patula]